MVRLGDYEKMSKVELIDYINSVCKKVDVDKELLTDKDKKLSDLKQHELVQLVVDFEGGLFDSFPDKIEETRLIFNETYTSVTGKEV